LFSLCWNFIDALCTQPQIFHSNTFAELLSELSGFPHLTTLVIEMPRDRSNRWRWPADREKALSLATGFMNANPALRRVAFEITGDRRWPCYIRAQGELDYDGDGTAVFEGFDILGPDSWRDVHD
jgi:hypothetical protein